MNDKLLDSLMFATQLRQATKRENMFSDDFDRAFLVNKNDTDVVSAEKQEFLNESRLLTGLGIVFFICATSVGGGIFSDYRPTIADAEQLARDLTEDHQYRQIVIYNHDMAIVEQFDFDRTISTDYPLFEPLHDAPTSPL